MQAHRLHTLRLIALAATASIALGLAACEKKPAEPTVGERVDGAIADVKEAGTEAADSVKASAADAAITTKINAALAADDKLSATKINVDTVDGRVTLSGTAPDATSRDRATTLATSVEGVLAVNNLLIVQGS